VLLILAQNTNRCVNTPFVYNPTHSPDYYEALATLYDTIHGHGHGGHSGHDAHAGHDAHSGYPYGYGHGTYASKYPKYPSYGTSYSFPTVYTTYHGHPTYNLKKIPNTIQHSGYKTYAPGQGYGTGQYNVQNKYKVVVKRNRPARKKYAEKLQGKRLLINIP
jgi:hypothetical protein